MKTKTRSQPSATAADTPQGRAAAGRNGALVLHPMLIEASTAVRVRQRQRLALSIDSVETLYVVRSGLMALTAQVEGRGRQVLQLLYPGEVFRTAFAPPLPEVALTALSAGEVRRLSWTTFEQLLQREPGLGGLYSQQAARQSALSAMHAAVVSALTGEERVAAFLIEVVLRLGRQTATGIAFDLPLSREDIADYLALNADTLSRIMSRLKARGLFTLAGRGHGLLREFEGLCQSTPMARTLIDMHGPVGSA
jgi:CRP-like cAMP-binding protein